jgi:hypothetical protein
LNILLKDLSLKYSRFSAITFIANPNTAIDFVPRGIGVARKKSAITIPIGEIVETRILRNIQNGLLCIE